MEMRKMDTGIESKSFTTVAKLLEQLSGVDESMGAAIVMGSRIWSIASTNEAGDFAKIKLLKDVTDDQGENTIMTIHSLKEQLSSMKNYSTILLTSNDSSRPQNWNITGIKSVDATEGFAKIDLERN